LRLGGVGEEGEKEGVAVVVLVVDEEVRDVSEEISKYRKVEYQNIRSRDLCGRCVGWEDARNCVSGWLSESRLVWIGSSLIITCL
jgi:hypothetical protein